jgi:hypothetical protein
MKYMRRVASENMTDQRRALLTEREREILTGEADVTDNYRYSIESRIRKRLRERLGDDVDVIREYYPEIFDELIFPVICEPTAEADAGGGERDTTHEPAEEVHGSIETSLDDNTPREAVATDAGGESTDAGGESTDPIGDALAGWSYGRTDEEQEANDAVARASLEWLHDEADGVARKSDVPLDELEDPLDRKGDTLWRSVIRGAWQHATGQGYIEMPDSRGYKWAGE